MSRVEVMSGPERRRRWSEEQKRAIVAEAFAPGASVSEVARRRDVVSGQIYRWRREFGGSAVGFAEVVVSPPPPHEMSQAAEAAVVEIEFGPDIRVRLPMTTPKELACAVIRALATR
jgi:transposase